ncbi:hypothetical protein FHR83_004564 [Actinoplanes campanulatus]|uniref:Uncharacterized protein n=1 Tax=Actinoplanes campanulatus TaxID=113559 RepID=A0A7W5AIW0_9ACTN|nr:hypothetical protein [Actinoplanes campanulatus]MBB3096890.1 hypothetical protein [Actinoplanes campanulatus]GGN44736.1 hypothetical protein GCM10010109_78220 [Actinoplanes campanulatus]GID37433.1 hypothetical protein Aca09nite_39390 [Actinoplanes campanulatus]
MEWVAPDGRRVGVERRALPAAMGPVAPHARGAYVVRRVPVGARAARRVLPPAWTVPAKD